MERIRNKLQNFFTFPRSKSGRPFGAFLNIWQTNKQTLLWFVWISFRFISFCRQCLDRQMHGNQLFKMLRLCWQSALENICRQDKTKIKTSQECKTALTSQYKTLLFVFVYHSDHMSEGSQVSKVTLCVQILKWRSLCQVSQSLTKGRYKAAWEVKNITTGEMSWSSYRSFSLLVLWR